MTSRRWGVAVISLPLVAALAACGGGGGSDGVATLGGAGENAATDDTTDASVDPQDAAVEYARCMREHGIDMPDPEIGEGGDVRIAVRAGPGARGKSPNGGDADFEEAEKECGPILRNALGADEGPSPEEEAEMRDRMLEFARCMREHGVDMPDPDFDGGGLVKIGRPGDEAPADDDTFRAAEQACGDILGEFGARRETAGSR